MRATLYMGRAQVIFDVLNYSIAGMLYYRKGNAELHARSANLLTATASDNRFYPCFTLQ